ncbi:WD repeat domain 33 [Rhynchophorus ferrugineus]|uniref:Pre-mRNA 3' end processing protein WDR33 n=1 Tax=Rhynchophorus ferrugineus TaxID=354439 RepID=A0A834MM25_RHYFE|nr:hypothetical protein GWI33_000566 [Rhynchophorus ferrugineus]
MDFAQPPPNMSMPPPNLAVPPNNMGFNNMRPQFRPFMNVHKPLPGPLGDMTLEDFDGKRLRKSVMRKTVDYNSSIIKELENRIWQRDYRDRRALQPDVMYYPDLMPPPSYPDNPINCVTTRFVKTATNKIRCPIFCIAWTPEGRRLVTGASSGEFTLWNGLTFNFETILQAHDSPVRTMVWSHNDSWMVTGDHAGYVKYWQSNMNNVKMFQAHKEALRGISFSPSDTKFVTCSDDGTLRIWDFFRYQEERVLRGHGADVKCVHWHPQKGLIISGSKDNQQPIKLWDPKSGQSLATLHAHKSTVMDLKWNANGNWLITASRDHLLKLFDLRNLSQEVQTFRGHKKEASSVAWHPVHEGLFASGGSDGAIMFWHVGADKEVGAIEQAHDSIVWTLAWHPLGHILCSGSNDHTSKFWTRNRPGDQMRDKYNLNTLPAGIAGFDDMEVIGGDEPSSVIPGMGPEDKVELTALIGDENTAIPGLDLDSGLLTNEDKPKPKKVPFSKPIPRNFQAQWNETSGADDGINDVISKLVENTPGVVPLEKIAPNAIIIYGKLIPVEPGSKLEKAISEGPDALQKFIDSGEIEELHDVMPIRDSDEEDYLKDTNHDEINNMHNITNEASDNQYFDEDDRSMRSNDQDMRSFNPKGDSDMRMFGNNDMRNQDTDFRTPIDFDMRNPPPMNHFGPGGMRPGGPMGPGGIGPRGLRPRGPMGPGMGIMGPRGPGLLRPGAPRVGDDFACDEYGDEDYRNTSNKTNYDDSYDDDYEEEYYDDDSQSSYNSGWQRNGGNNFNYRGRGNFRGHPPQPQSNNYNSDWNGAPNPQEYRGRGGRGRGRGGRQKGPRGKILKNNRGRGSRGRGGT